MKLFFPILILFVMGACSSTKTAAQQTPTAPAAVVVAANPTFIVWDKKKQDLGKIKKGEKRTLFFEFTNTSGGDIQIEIVDACECTKVEFPRGIIPAGGKSRLDATFDSTEKDIAETIGINVVFKNTDAAGNPRIELVEYSFDIEK